MKEWGEQYQRGTETLNLIEPLSHRAIDSFANLLIKWHNDPMTQSSISSDYFPLADLVRVSAVAKGEEIVEAEEELFGLFQSGKLNEKTLRE